MRLLPFILLLSLCVGACLASLAMQHTRHRQRARDGVKEMRQRAHGVKEERRRAHGEGEKERRRAHGDRVKEMGQRHGDRVKEMRQRADGMKERQRALGRKTKQHDMERRRSRKQTTQHSWRRRLPSWLLPWMREGTDPGFDFSTFATFRVWMANKRWWEGPNVCQTEKEEEDTLENGLQLTRHSFITSTECDESDTQYTCVNRISVNGTMRQTTVTYECCHGYRREARRPGCTEELVLKDLLETVEELGATQLVRAVESSGLRDFFSSGNYTIFAPTDGAFKRFQRVENNQYELGLEQEDAVTNTSVLRVLYDMVSMAKDIKKTVQGHVLPGFVRLSHVADEQLLSTEIPSAKIRINKFSVPQQIETANCARITKRDIAASNGIVHEVDRVLEPVTNSIMGIVGKTPELSTLKTILGKTGMVQQLKKAGHMTLLAPTNEAFVKLHGRHRQLDEGGECLANMVKNMLLPNVICSAALTGRAKTQNALRRYVHLTKTKDEKFFVDGGQLISRDIMGTNGVIHIIDKVLVPDEAQNVMDVAEQVNATKMLHLIKHAELVKYFSHLRNFTLFLPTDAAIENLPEQTLKHLKKNPKTLVKILKYHVLSTEKDLDSLHNDDKLSTANSEKKILVKQYSSYPFGVEKVRTVQCAPIKKSNMKVCGGVIHIVDKMLLPARGDVLDILYQDSQFRLLVGLLKEAGFAEELQLSGPFTFFAPTNQAIESLSEETMKRLKSDKEVLKGFLQRHVIHDSLCCSGIFSSRWLWKQRELTLDGSFLTASRQRDEISVDGIPISRCDITATNGVVHAIDTVLPPAVHKYTRRPETPKNHRGKHSKLLGLHSSLTSLFDDHLQQLGHHLDDLEDWGFDAKR